jgi:hypothetical protein
VTVAGSASEQLLRHITARVDEQLGDWIHSFDA